MYYFLRQDLFHARDIIDIAGHTEETGKYMWVEGTKFAEPVPEQTLLLNPEYGSVMPDFFDSTIPLMSDRFLEAVRRAGVDNFDSYSMVLQHPETGKEWRNYKAMNFIGCVDAIDEAKSDCRKTSTGRLRCKSIAVDAKAVGDSLAFRLKRGPHLLVIHERVADELRNQEFIAVMIQKTEDYEGA